MHSKKNLMNLSPHRPPQPRMAQARFRFSTPKAKPLGGPNQELPWYIRKDL